MFRVPPNGMSVARSQRRWRAAVNVSKTCDCIEGFLKPARKSSSSPPLLAPRQLAEQARAVSSPVPLPAAEQFNRSLPISSAAKTIVAGVATSSSSSRNASGGSGLSETGSLDRAKAALERRKKAEDGSGNAATICRVEVTRPNPDSLIDEIIKATNLEGSVLESSETTGLQLFIAKDGTTALGSHEVKAQMPAGVFKQVVMEENSSR